MSAAACGGSRRGRGISPAGLWLVIGMVAVTAPRSAAADWSDSFPGGTPSQTWFWNRLNADGSAASTTATYAPGSVSVSSTTPVFPQGGPLAFFGVVPQVFSGRQLVSSRLLSTGSATQPTRDAGVFGLLNTTTLDAYSATIDYPDGGGLDLSRISLGSPTNMRPQRNIPNFSQAQSYTVELEQFGQSITARAYTSAGALVSSVSAVDPFPYTAGLAGLAVSRPDTDDVIRSQWGTTSASTPAATQFWTGDGVVLAGSGDFSASSTTFLANGSGPATAWNPAQPAVFTADSEFFQNTDPAAPNFYEAYRVPTPIHVARVPSSGVPVNNALKFYANQYSIRWLDTGDPTYSNFTGGNGLILSGTAEFNVAPDVIGTISARLTGAGGFRKTGPGTLNLVNMFSSFTGDVTIDEGTVFIGSNGYENSGVTNNLGAADAARRVVVNSGGVLSFRTIEGMAEGNSQSPVGARSTQTLVANAGGLITNNIMIEQATEDNPLDNWHYQGAYTAVGNVELNDGEMLGQATFWNDLWTYATPQAVTRDTYPGFQAFMLQGSVTSTGNSRIAMRASTEFQNEWNRVSNNGTGGDGLFTYNDSTGFHLNWLDNGTTFNVVSGTLTVSANLLDSPAGDSSETPGGSRDSIRAGLTKTGAGTMIVSGSNWMTGLVLVDSGVLRAENPGGNQPLQWTPTVVFGGELQLGGAPDGPFDSPGLQVWSLTAENGGRVRMPNGFSSGTASGPSPLVVSTGSLAIDKDTGGRLDLGNGAVVAGGITPTALVAGIIAGRDGNPAAVWTGTSGITSSVAASLSAAGTPRAVGWLDLGGGLLQVAFSAAGDTNLDWTVDILDAANFLAGGKFDSGTPATWNQGDFGYDGMVDILDAADFLSTGLFDLGPYNTPSPTAGIAAVPEPSAMAIVLGGLAGGGLLHRRRRPQA